MTEIRAEIRGQPISISFYIHSLPHTIPLCWVFCTGAGRFLGACACWDQGRSVGRVFSEPRPFPRAPKDAEPFLRAVLEGMVFFTGAAVMVVEVLGGGEVVATSTLAFLRLPPPGLPPLFRLGRNVSPRGGSLGPQRRSGFKGLGLRACDWHVLATGIVPF